MTAHQLAQLACKLIAVWVGAQVVQQWIGTAYLAVEETLYNVGRRGPPSRTFLAPMVTLVLFALPIAAGVFLWVRSGWLAGRLVGDAADATVPGGPGVERLLSVGLIVAGAAILVPATRDLAGAAAVAANSHHNFSDWWHDAYWLRAFWSAAVGIGLSAWLMFGGRGLAHLIVRARTAGHPAPPPVVDPPAPGDG